MRGQEYVDAVVTACVREARKELGALADDLALDVQVSGSYDELRARLVKRLNRCALVTTRALLERAIIVTELAGRLEVLERG